MDVSTTSTTNLTGDNRHDEVESMAMDGFERSRGFGVGILDDFKRRSRFYVSDFSDSVSSKTLSASAFMFFATVFSTIALGTHLQSSSNESIGVQEYLLMNGMSGIVFALVSPQPLMILRPTGPITLILENLVSISNSYHIDFWQLLAYSGYFVGLYLIVLSSLEASTLMQRLTRFTYEIFGCYVCSVYIFSGVQGVVYSFHADSYPSPSSSKSSGDDYRDTDDLSTSFVLASALFTVITATVTLCLALLLSSCAATPEARQPSWSDKSDRLPQHLPPDLSSLRIVSTPLSGGEEPGRNADHDTTCHWTVGTPTLRGFLSDYAVTIAVLIVTGLSFLPALYGLTEASSEQQAALQVDRVSIPHTSFPPIPTSAEGDGRSTWLVDFTDADDNDGDAWRTVCVSALVAVPIAFFFFVDQSLSALLSQKPHMEGMRKGVYLHGPLALIAVFNIIGPSFGLPFVTASLPHSPQLVEALTSRRTSSVGSAPDSVCAENRVAPLLVYLLILGVATIPVLTPLVRCMPVGAIRGTWSYQRCVEYEDDH